MLIHATRFKVNEFDILRTKFLLIVGLNNDKFPESSLAELTSQFICCVSFVRCDI